MKFFFLLLGLFFILNDAYAGDAQRFIFPGEKVITNARTYRVQSVDEHGRMNLIPLQDYMGKLFGVARTAVAVTDGCTLSLCVGDRVRVIDSMATKASVIGLTYDDRFVVEIRHDHFRAVVTYAFEDLIKLDDHDSEFN